MPSINDVRKKHVMFTLSPPYLLLSTFGIISIPSPPPSGRLQPSGSKPTGTMYQITCKSSSSYNQLISSTAAVINAIVASADDM